MANEEQLAILRQGVEVWNKWRTEDAYLIINLEEAKLTRTDLKRINLWGANLLRANLDGTDFRLANFGEANLQEANLMHANLMDADLATANLRKANLVDANLGGADFRQAILIDSDLSETNLRAADLSEAQITGSNFLKAEIGYTIFGDLDLSEVAGLEGVIHRGPSKITISTFVLSKGNIPTAFLQGCGLSDWQIETVKLYNPNLSNEEINKTLYRIYDLRATQALQISPLFISYSHGDIEFVNKVDRSLAQKGIRFWRDIHDLKAGRIEKQIDSAISQGRTVLLVLSEHSLASDWVEHEVRTARELEKDMERDVLCPIALDDSWKSSRWPARIMEQIREYNILDFSEWEDDVKFDGMFRKLIDGLELFYKG